MYIFTKDLRLSDNRALLQAIEGKEQTLLVYILDTRESEQIGGASCSWLHHSLHNLALDIAQKGGKLILKRGDPTRIIPELMAKHGFAEVFFNDNYEPGFFADIKYLKKLGITTKIFSSTTLFSPETILTKQGSIFRVFTPFYKALQKSGPPEKCLKAPKWLPPSVKEKSLTLAALNLVPALAWDAPFYQNFTPGEKGAQVRLEQFFATGKDRYQHDRDYPQLEGTSYLSPHLHWGEISARQIWYYFILQNQRPEHPFLREIVWREFAYYLLYHFPKTPQQPFQAAFTNFPWRNNAKLLKKWQKGLTGYPIVDAAMRQLWQDGWMHNRLRMIVASFLVKDLMIPWQKGAAWFWDTLLDADLANNTLGWQWCAGCGADAAPYFRIFNPTTQGEKFDPEGAFIRKYVPELSQLEAKWIHKPHLAPPEILKKAGVILGKNYPLPLVDHAKARLEALDLYQKWKSS